MSSNIRTRTEEGNMQNVSIVYETDGTISKDENGNIYAINNINQQLLLLPPDCCKFVFTHDTILLLLSLVEKYIDRFRSRIIKKEKFWSEIAQIFKEQGYMVTSQELDRKSRNLKSTYVSIKDHQGKTGRDRKNWPYFSKFEDIFSCDYTVNATTKLNLVSTCKDIPFVSVPTATESNNESSNSSASNSSIHFENTVIYLDEAQSSEASCSNVKKRRKTTNNKPEWTDKIMALQKQHTEQLQQMQSIMEKSNVIQEKRNTLLEKFLEKQ